MNWRERSKMMEKDDFPALQNEIHYILNIQINQLITQIVHKGITITQVINKS